MLLSKDQVNLFWRLWAKACKAQSWDREHGLNSAAVDARRKAFLKDCGFESLTLVDQIDGFSKVKRELLKLDVQIQGAREEVQPEIERSRKARWFIEHDLVPCLALYVEDAWAYVYAVAEDKFRWWKKERPTRQLTLDDLSDDPIIRTIRGELRESPSELEQLKMTLAGRLSGKDGLRNQAGHSVHAMRTAAGLDCYCKRCREMAVLHEAEKLAPDALANHPPVPVSEPEVDPENCPF